LPEDGIAVVNLNLRSVVAGDEKKRSILADLVRRLTAPEFWEPCQQCDLRDKCYVHHNALTLADASAGAQVIRRLELLYRLVTLRGKLHITMRDLRSALAYMLAGTRNCVEIHDLYEAGKPDAILAGFYFNSYAAAGDADPQDRLVRLLKEIDVAKTNDPKLDRAFDFHPPDPSPALMEFQARGRYERDLLKTVYSQLPLDYSVRENPERLERHRRYVEMLRRRYFFEVRDESWRRLIPYDAAGRMLRLLEPNHEPADAALKIIEAINHGEGISHTSRLQSKLAIQVRHVDSGVLRSYRVFDAAHFTLVPQEAAHQSTYLEHSPTALLLRYRNPETDLSGEMVINLDVFEMLDRLNRGYRPTVDELQGYYLALAVFKNILGSAPYQEVLLTPNAREFYSVQRRPDASLVLRVAEETANYNAAKS
jgi:hypothetical protein